MTRHVIREARPQDAEFLAWAILTAARGHLQRGWFDIALNQPEKACLEFLMRLSITDTPSWWHYSRFLVVEGQARPVAALSAFRAGDAYPLSQAAISETAEALGIPGPEQAAIWQRGGYLFLCATGSHEDCWTVENVATLPSHRGSGFATALLERAIDDGRAQGLKEAQITVFIGNRSAERVYEKAGFRVAGEERHPDFEAAAGAPGLRRFIRPL
jgi:ribosomal protein S18 acetylase RimI-like enzyme